MPIFRPFRGIRPNEDFLDCFPTHPLESFTQEEINKKAQEDSSYIQMVKPYVVSKSKDIDRNLRKIRTNFEELLVEKKLIQDASSYYLYEQITPEKMTFRGLLGLSAVEDFNNGKIKPHEGIIPQKIEKLAHYTEKVHLQSDPILLTYASNSKVELFMNYEEKNVPIINYLDGKGIKHKIWKIDNRLKMQQLKEVLDQIESFYIADGHHRINAIVQNANKLKEKTKRPIGNDPHNFILSFIVSNQSIKIHDYNRFLKHLEGLSVEEFLEKLKKSFHIHEKGIAPYYPSQKFHISLYLDGKFYSLHLKHDLRSLDLSLDNLDHHLLDKYVFQDILGIKDTNSSENINYTKGRSSMEGINKIKSRVDSGDFVAGFGIFPVSFNDIIKISDEKLVMPPKCTYIEPKLVTGLIMYDMK